MSETRRLKNSFQVRLDDATHSAIMARSLSRNVSAGTIIREMIAENLGSQSSGIISVPRKKPARKAQPEDVLELARLREAMAETCGALVQCSIRSREAGHLDTHGKIEELLPIVRKYTRKVDRLKVRLQVK